ncbi:glycosyl hydrolase family 20, catalytic domain protein [Streptomyces xiamenensis]|uniref:beta-N-acetylhexosaminidase n=1 Tax=Streptomyces xiamenensis TaxID=408015 RepID=A0A0F7FYU5_9ACTN|nr:beta-N-acetylhexosaminidase [Streptomyces xiamenensis]AKG45257.1 glycosyl hydrolase family 20, catalytic domain protein [Streptomyces xiamenensis]
MTAENAETAGAPGTTGADLVPAPLTYTPGPGAGPALGPGAVLHAAPGTEGTARLLRAFLGLEPSGAEHGPRVRLTVDPELAGGPEAYRLIANEDGVLITGGGPAGVFWGAQTLRQLAGSDAYRHAPLTGREWRLPAVTVEDAPRFAWRGFMLDVSRHFLPKAGVLRQLDLMAAHKLNVLHLHLTDDQGWRVQIDRYPELTATGAWRPRSRYGHRHSPLWDERPHGGFYTREDLREIVAYAAGRHITVVPEIELPGHSQAAIAAYPWLGNEGHGSPGVWTDWGISPHVLAPTDEVLRFYENVLAEVLEIFPSRFIHIGGDECPKDQWRTSPVAQERIAREGLRDEDGLQSWFIRHFDRWLSERGRRLIGWDEILEGGLAPGAAVSSWRGYEGGIAAASAGHDVVMCPEQFVYLDHRQAPGEDEPMPVGWVRTLRDVYEFEPVPPALAGQEAERHVIGTQANLWTELVDSEARADYQTYPRLCALAEVAWSAPGRRSWPDFAQRMTRAHYARLDALGVAYRPPGGPHPWQRRPMPAGHSGQLGRPVDGEPG